MDGKAGETADVSKDNSETLKNNEEDPNLSDLDKVEKVLEVESQSKLRFLDFEKQMFLDCVFNDGLVICAK